MVSTMLVDPSVPFVGWSNSGSLKPPHRAAPMRCRPQPVASVAHAPRGSTRFNSYDPPKRRCVFYCFGIWPSINKYPLVICYISDIWTWTFIMSFFPLKMVMFYGYVSLLDGKTGDVFFCFGNLEQWFLKRAWWTNWDKSRDQTTGTHHSHILYIYIYIYI